MSACSILLPSLAHHPIPHLHVSPLPPPFLLLLLIGCGRWPAEATAGTAPRAETAAGADGACGGAASEGGGTEERAGGCGGRVGSGLMCDVSRRLPVALHQLQHLSVVTRPVQHTHRSEDRSVHSSNLRSPLRSCLKSTSTSLAPSPPPISPPSQCEARQRALLEALQQASEAAAASGDGLAAESPFRHLVLRKRKRKDLRAAVSSLKVCVYAGGRMEGGGAEGGEQGERKRKDLRAAVFSLKAQEGLWSPSSPP